MPFETWGGAFTILEPSDACKNLAKSDQNECWDLYPHADGRVSLYPAIALAFKNFGTGVHLFAACSKFVDVILDNASDNHSRNTQHESSEYALDRCETNITFTEERVEESIANGNEDDQSQWVDILDQVIWDAIQFQGCGLRREVVGHLVVCKPVEGIP